MAADLGKIGGQFSDQRKLISRVIIVVQNDKLQIICKFFESIFMILVGKIVEFQF